MDRPDDLSYDLGHLAAFDSSHITAAEVRSDDGFLDSYSRDGVQLLVNAIFALPTQPLPTDPGLLATLPVASTRLPRAKPLPQPSPDTRWEQFAKRKGIVKKKRGRMEWDEQKQQYAPRFGYGRANDESENVVIEEKDDAATQSSKRSRRGAADVGGAAVVDPWTRLEEERKQRRAKNDKQRRSNLQAASGNRVAGTIDLGAVQPNKADGRRRPASGSSSGSKQHHVDLALSVAQQSTASMGKFDARRYSEPERKRVDRKQADETDRKREKESQLAMLSRLLGKDAAEGAATLDVDKAANVTKGTQERRGSGSNRGAVRGNSRRGGRGGRSTRGGRGGKGS